MTAGSEASVQGDPVVRSARVSTGSFVKVGRWPDDAWWDGLAAQVRARRMERFLAAVVAVNNYDAQHQELIGQATAEREVLVAEMWATVQS